MDVRFLISAEEHLDVVIELDGEREGEEGDCTVAIRFDDGGITTPLEVFLGAGTREECVSGIEETIAALTKAKAFLTAPRLSS